MVFEDHTVYGIFQEELKNRFLCRVTIDGKDTICYIPSSCRLSNFIEMTGKTVMLKRIQSKGARTQYSVYAVKIKNHYIPVNLSGANGVIESNMSKRYFSCLGRRKVIQREVKISGYKSDLFIADTNTIVEIKSILSLNKTAVFPTVFSERAINQLLEIERLINEGYRICYIFVSLNSSVDKIEINHQETAFYSKMRHLVNMGMQCIAVSLCMVEDQIKIKHQIPLILEDETIK